MARSSGLLAVIVLTLGLSGGAHGQDSQRERFERGQKVQRDFEQERLVAVSLAPLVGIQAERREVRQAVLSDPYGMMPMPSLQLERSRKGAVRLVFRDRDGAERARDLPPESWSNLTKLEGAIFKPRRFKPWYEPPLGLPRPPPPPICHGWAVFLGATGRAGAHTASASACGGESPALAYGAAMARLALATRPDCAVDTDPFWSFQRCFGQKPPGVGG